MELKATSLLLLMCVSIIILTEAGSSNAIPTCCLSVSEIPRWMLYKVKRSETQSRSGRCEIDALILFFKDKKYCAHPRTRKLLEKIKKMKKMKKNRKPKRA